MTTPKGWADMVVPLRDAGIPIIVVGDLGSEPWHDDRGVDFLSWDRCAELYPALHAAIPAKSYTRKNLGYAHAVARGACRVLDIDDDNFPTPAVMQYLSTFAGDTSEALGTAALSAAGRDRIFNIYPLYGSSIPIWPRGLPMRPGGDVDGRTTFVQPRAAPLGVVQLMQDRDPDVNAVWRLASPLPFFWGPSQEMRESAVAVAAGALSPSNSQATLFARALAPFLFIPPCLPVRVSDIWRSFVVQRFLWRTPLRLGFLGTCVDHRRNAHNYLHDLEAEKRLYEDTDRLVDTLLALEPTDTLTDALRAIADAGLIQQSSLDAFRIFSRVVGRADALRAGPAPAPPAPPLADVLVVLRARRHPAAAPLFAAAYRALARHVVVDAPPAVCRNVSRAFLECADGEDLRQLTRHLPHPPLFVRVQDRLDPATVYRTVLRHARRHSRRDAVALQSLAPLYARAAAHGSREGAGVEAAAAGGASGSPVGATGTAFSGAAIAGDGTAGPTTAPGAAL